MSFARFSPARLFNAIPTNLRGMLLILVAALSVAGMNVTVRFMAGEIHVFEIAFFRNVFGFMIFLPIYMRAEDNALATHRIGLLGLRALLNTVAMLAYFMALTLIPLAEITALSFTSPLFASLLAVFILREAMGRHRLISLVVGLAGALIILQPGVQEVGLGSLLVLLSSVVWACALIVIKVLSRTESSLTIAMYAALLQVPLAFPAALFVWQWPTFEQLLFMALVGAFGSVAQIALAQAFVDADATLVLPVDFTKLIWASIAGFLFFAEIPAIWTWVGGAIIFAGVIYSAYHERDRRKAGEVAH